MRFASLLHVPESIIVRIKGLFGLEGACLERKKFFEKQGYKLNIQDPQSFNEKVVYKKLFDRNPLLPITADKYSVRDYVKRVLGEEEGGSILVPLLYSTEEPDTVPFESLKGSYIIKASHSSGRNIIVREGEKVDRAGVVSQCKKWLQETFGVRKMEWAYSQIKPRILVEKLLISNEGEVPVDYKFYIFGGKCEMVHVDYDRFTHHTRSLYDPDWNHLGVRLKFPLGPVTPKPESFDRMRLIAEKLGKDFDFVRVDLYTLGQDIFFGELTHYPGSGMERFEPRSYDFKLGTKWTQNYD